MTTLAGGKLGKINAEWRKYQPQRWCARDFKQVLKEYANNKPVQKDGLVVFLKMMTIGELGRVANNYNLIACSFLYSRLRNNTI